MQVSLFLQGREGGEGVNKFKSRVMFNQMFSTGEKLRVRCIIKPEVPQSPDARLS